MGQIRKNAKRREIDKLRYPGHWRSYFRGFLGFHERGLIKMLHG